MPVLNSRFVEGAALGILARAYAGTLDGLFTALLDVFTHLRKAPLRRPEDFRYVYEKVRLFAHRKLNNDVFRPTPLLLLWLPRPRPRRNGSRDTGQLLIEPAWLSDTA